MAHYHWQKDIKIEKIILTEEILTKCQFFGEILKKVNKMSVLWRKKAVCKLNFINYTWDEDKIRRLVHDQKKDRKFHSSKYFL